MIGIRVLVCWNPWDIFQYHTKTWTNKGIEYAQLKWGTNKNQGDETKNGGTNRVGYSRGAWEPGSNKILDLTGNCEEYLYFLAFIAK